MLESKTMDLNFFLLSFIFLLFLYYSLFFILGLELRVISQSYCHTSVTSDDMVTVLVTQAHNILEKYKDSEKDDII